MSEFEEKAIKLLEIINSKLDKLIGDNSDSTIAPTPSTPEPTPTVSTPQPTVAEPAGGLKPSEVIDKQKEEERIKVAPPVEGRRKCPECGGNAFDEREDRSQPPIHQMGGIKIYKKKITCKKCSYTFPV